jgi:membrane protein DedA with SNARE-associated domain
MSDAATALALAAGTLVSEDLAAIGAAALSAHGHIDVWTATAAVTTGIYAGDLLLFGCGRASSQLPLVERCLTSRWSIDQLNAFAIAFDRRLPLTVISSRFLPGTRLPTYVAAGMFSQRPLAFCLWTLLAVSIWTPLLVIGVLWIGEAFETAARSYFRWAPALGVMAMLHVAGGLVAKGKR